MMCNLALDYLNIINQGWKALPLLVLVLARHHEPYLDPPAGGHNRGYPWGAGFHLFPLPRWDPSPFPLPRREPSPFPLPRRERLGEGVILPAGTLRVPGKLDKGFTLSRHGEPLPFPKPSPRIRHQPGSNHKT